jgi:hypothetical protein
LRGGLGRGSLFFLFFPSYANTEIYRLGRKTPEKLEEKLHENSFSSRKLPQKGKTPRKTPGNSTPAEK